MNKKTSGSQGIRDDGNSTESHFPDPMVLSEILLDVFQKTQPLWTEFLKKNDFKPGDLLSDPLNVQPAWASFMGQLMAHPEKLAEMQLNYWQSWTDLWLTSTRKFLDGEQKELYRPEKGDKRFRSPLWQQSALFDFIKESYLLTSAWVQDFVHQEAMALSDDDRRKLEFYTKQYLDAVAPSNFLLTNPEALKETIDTKGENLLRGFQNLLEDLGRGQGSLAISTTDYGAFEPGRNIATTPGKVIYENELVQLIQYNAATEEVFQTPLLIVPPWINKYYILDLRPDNSLIKWLTEQGHTVFILSWVNPDRRLSSKRFEDYMDEGIIEALTQIEKVTGEASCNVMGYCLGGTLLAVSLAWLAAKGQGSRIASATLLTTLVDFEKAGDIKIFFDADQLKLLDKEMAEKGFLPASHLKKTFSLLRANDMIWTFVVNNYLLGREPFPFDLLYWNDDSTNMPAEMHSFYMRKCYLENLLPVPGGVEIKNVPIDMSKVETPTYILSTKDDHIAPWEATYETSKLLSGPIHFTLAASGHVAGVINPPSAEKYSFWVSPEIKKDAHEWFKQAHEHQGSWWPHWQKWVKRYAGKKVPARKIGGNHLKPIEDAPGRYVKTRA